MKTDVKKIGSKFVHFGAGAFGLTAGSIAMKQVAPLLAKLPSWFPDIAKKLTPGLVGMLAAYLLSEKFKDEKAQSLFFGLGLAGFADALRNGLGPFVPLINDNVPTLRGLGIVQNYGEYPSSYMSSTTTPRLQGRSAYNLSGRSAYNLQGMGNAYSLMGPSQGSSASANLLN